MDLKETLAIFNRKERNWLVRDALGNASNTLCENFCMRITKAILPAFDDFCFDKNPYWATDYHFDWIVGALHSLKYPDEKIKTPIKNIPRMVAGNQEDIDLVIATGNTLLLIEAKGEGQWSNSQLQSKIGRLKAMTPSLISPDGWAGEIRIAFLLCSPRVAPTHVLAVEWPKWAQQDGHPLHFELKRPSEHFHAVSRCNEFAGLDADGRNWLVRNINYEKKTT